MNDDTNETPVDPPARADTVAITTGRSHAGRALGSVLHASAVGVPGRARSWWI